MPIVVFIENFDLMLLPFCLFLCYPFTLAFHNCGFYTQDEIKEIVDYAAKRNITIVPEIEMPRHVNAALAAYPWLGPSGKEVKVPPQFGINYTVLNVADPRVLQFIEDVLDEIISLFPGNIIHIGGDEVLYDEWRASPVIQAYMCKNNIKTPSELQIFFTNNVSKMLASKNRRMMGWNDITGDKIHEYHSEDDVNTDQHLSRDAIVHFWKGTPELLKKIIENGYDVVNSYHLFTYFGYNNEILPLEKAYSFNPIPEGLLRNNKNMYWGLVVRCGVNLFRQKII